MAIINNGSSRFVPSLGLLFSVLNCLSNANVESISWSASLHGHIYTVGRSVGHFWRNFVQRVQFPNSGSTVLSGGRKVEEFYLVQPDLTSVRLILPRSSDI